MNYGLPYQGSKSKIAPWVIEHLPEADNLYDLFGGGGAITHAALLSDKWKTVYYNDIQKGLTQLFVDAVNGKYKNETEWISREEFFKRNETDMYVRYCWSFGNIGNAYLYGKPIEEYKHGIHNAVLFQDYDILKKFGVDFKSDKKTVKERKTEYNKYIKENKARLKQLWKEKCEILSEEKPDNMLLQLQSLESLERLQSLERLERLQRLVASCKSYDEFEILQNSVIYCDIPYFNTAKYCEQNFDYEKFYDWCEKQTVPVYISEYWMPEDRFECISEKEVTRKLYGVSSKKCNEKLFIPKRKDTV